MVFEIKDITGLSAPATKLVEVVSAGMGTLYRPRAIRTEAAAKADELKIISQAQAEAEASAKSIALKATLERLEMITAKNPEIAARATQRLLAREIEGQENIDAIVNHAMLALPNHVSDEEVSPDWRRRFFIEAENVCAADMQFLWGKVLAGEVSRPGSFSIRTLDALRYLTQTEAELFRKACSISMQDGWIALPGHDLNSALKPFGITYGDLLTLRDLGLMVDGDHIRKNFTPLQPIADPANYKIVLVNNGKLIELSGAMAGYGSIPALILSKVGRELQQLIDPAPNAEYFIALGKHLKALSFIAKLGKIISSENGSSVIVFEEEMADMSPNIDT